MKKKITLLSLLLVLTMVMGLIGGCGKTSSTGSKDSGASSAANLEKITVSEMLANMVKETDGKVYIYTTQLPKDENGVYYTVEDFLTGDEDMQCWLDLMVYDGSNVQKMYEEKATGKAVYLMNPKYEEKTLEEQTKIVETASMNGFKQDKRQTESYPYQKVSAFLFIPENTKIERLGYVDSESLPDYGLFFYENCYHVTIDDTSYIVFDEATESDKTALHRIVMLKDTDYTKDKMVVNDTVVDESKTITFNNIAYVPVKTDK